MTISKTYTSKKFYIILYDLLYYILIFENSFKYLILKCKSILFIIDTSTNLFQIYQELQKYNFKLNISLSTTIKSIVS